MISARLSFHIIKARKTSGRKVIVFFSRRSSSDGRRLTLFCWKCNKCYGITTVIRRGDFKQSLWTDHFGYPRLVVCSSCLTVRNTTKAARMPSIFKTESRWCFGIGVCSQLFERLEKRELKTGAPQRTLK